LRGRPLVVSRRVAFPVQQNVFSRRKYARADHYIAISNHVREQLLRGGIEDSRISVVYDGVALGGDGGGCSTLRPYVDAATTPVQDQRLPDGAHDRYALAPKINDPLKGADLLRDACRAAGVELRFSENLPEDLPRAAVFVYLSENEGLGSAILLAMARKTPVIASRVGGIPELVEHEVSGLLVENRVEDVAAALRRMVDDRDFAQQCAERAYQRACASFLDDIMVRRTEQIYRAVLEQRSPL
jgi:hypothetical protein